VIGPGPDLARLRSEQGSEVLAEIFVDDGPLDEEEQQQDMQQGLNARISEAQRCRASVVDDDGLLQLLEGGFANEAVMTDALDVEQTSVGRKADLSQFFKIFDASANGEIAGIVDRRFGAKGFALLVILLDAGLLVVDVERGHDALGDHPRAEPAGRGPGHLAVEHEAYWVGRCPKFRGSPPRRRYPP